MRLSADGAECLIPPFISIHADDAPCGLAFAQRIFDPPKLPGALRGRQPPNPYRLSRNAGAAKSNDARMRRLSRTYLRRVIRSVCIAVQPNGMPL